MIHVNLEESIELKVIEAFKEFDSQGGYEDPIGINFSICINNDLNYVINMGDCWFYPEHMKEIIKICDDEIEYYKNNDEYYQLIKSIK